MKELLKVKAVNFKKLQNHYLVFKSNDEIILFEYLLLMHIRCRGEKFYQIKKQFQFSILITPTRLDKLLKRLDDLNIITRTREGMPMRTYFQINEEVVAELFNINK